MALAHRPLVVDVDVHAVLVDPGEVAIAQVDDRLDRRGGNGRWIGQFRSRVIARDKVGGWVVGDDPGIDVPFDQQVEGVGVHIGDAVAIGDLEVAGRQLQPVDEGRAILDRAGPGRRSLRSGVR